MHFIIQQYLTGKVAFLAKRKECDKSNNQMNNKSCKFKQIKINFDIQIKIMALTSTSVSSESRLWIWILQLSMPLASKAESKCSTVRILYPSLQRVVHNSDSRTKSMDAGIKFEWNSKYLPSPANPGHIFTFETFPEWRVFPDSSMLPARVCWSLPVWDHSRS